MTFTYEEIEKVKTDIINWWGEQGKIVIAEAFNSHKKMPMSEFLEHCIMCGGDWGQMFLTGIWELYPKVYEAIPNDMGCNAWGGLCSTLWLCGVDPDE